MSNQEKQSLEVLDSYNAIRELEGQPLFITSLILAEKKADVVQNVLAGLNLVIHDRCNLLLIWSGHT